MDDEEKREDIERTNVLDLRMKRKEKLEGKGNLVPGSMFPCGSRVVAV